MDPFQVLPADVWGMIVFDMHPRKLFRLSHVSKRARSVVHNALRYIITRRCGVYHGGGITEFRRWFQCSHPGCRNVDYLTIDGKCRGHQPKPTPPVRYTPAGVIGGAGDGRDDRAERMLMATDLLNQRLQTLALMRQRQHPDD